jgi:hypothetical protein
MTYSHDKEIEYYSKSLDNILICLVYNKDMKFADPFVEMACKNIADYYYLNLILQNLKVSAVTSLKQALVSASVKQCRYVLYVELGNFLMFGHEIFDHIIDQLNEIQDTRFIGHILDYGNGSFYIHSQFFLIDAVWALANNVITIEPEDTNIEWQGGVIERSNENFHDHYTPKHVNATLAESTFIGRGRGWNILDKLCKTNSIMSPWQEPVRRKKEYLYPTVKEETSVAKSKIARFINAETAFVANTETIDIEKFNYVTENVNFKQIAIPAGGILPYYYPYLLGIDKVLIYDYSNTALNFAQNIINKWDGKNYKNFVTSNYDLKFLNETHHGRRFLDYNDKLINDLGPDFVEWWNKNKSQYVVQYLNIFDSSSATGVFKQLDDDTTLIYLSNILHYHKTSVLFSVGEMKEALIKFHNRVNKVISSENIYYKGTNPFTTRGLEGKLEEIDFGDEWYNKLPWRV